MSIITLYLLFSGVVFAPMSCLSPLHSLSLSVSLISILYLSFITLPAHSNLPTHLHHPLPVAVHPELNKGLSRCHKVKEVYKAGSVRSCLYQSKHTVQKLHIDAGTELLNMWFSNDSALWLELYLVFVISIPSLHSAPAHTNQPVVSFHLRSVFGFLPCSLLYSLVCISDFPALNLTDPNPR